MPLEELEGIPSSSAGSLFSQSRGTPRDQVRKKLTLTTSGRAIQFSDTKGTQDKWLILVPSNINIPSVCCLQAHTGFSPCFSFLGDPDIWAMCFLTLRLQGLVQSAGHVELPFPCSGRLHMLYSPSDLLPLTFLGAIPVFALYTRQAWGWSSVVHTCLVVQSPGLDAQHTTKS